MHLYISTYFYTSQSVRGKQLKRKNLAVLLHTEIRSCLVGELAGFLNHQYY